MSEAEASSYEMGMDEFLGHKTGGGSDTKYLSKWKDRAPPCVDVLLHRACGIAVAWRHSLPKLVPVKDKKTGEEVINVWSENAVCWEAEANLKKQNQRDDTGARKHPPMRCAVCKLLEHIRGLVTGGQLSWVDPIFKFSGSTEDVTWHAGGVYGAFSDWNMGADEKKEIYDAGIVLKDAWKENWSPKAAYIFRVVELGRPEAGTQVAIETGVLGDSVKLLIHNEVEGNGKEVGHPLINPYVIRWKYLKEEKKPQDKYQAVKMGKYDLSKYPAEMEAISSADPPQIDHLLKRFDAKAILARLRPHALIDLPWDTLFGDVEEGASNPDAVPAGPAAPAEEPGMVGCDDCGEAMKLTDPLCKACGKVYEVVQAPPPAKPALPKRSEVAKASTQPQAAKPAAAVQKAVAAPPAAKTKVEPAFAAGEVEDEDDLPFD